MVRIEERGDLFCVLEKSLDDWEVIEIFDSKPAAQIFVELLRLMKGLDGTWEEFYDRIRAA